MEFSKKPGKRTIQLREYTYYLVIQEIKTKDVKRQTLLLCPSF